MAPRIDIIVSSIQLKRDTDWHRSTLWMSYPPMSQADHLLKNLWQEDAALRKIQLEIAGSLKC